MNYAKCRWEYLTESEKIGIDPSNYPKEGVFSKNLVNGKKDGTGQNFYTSTLAIRLDEITCTWYKYSSFVLLDNVKIIYI